MSNRTTTRHSTRLGHGTLVIALATLLTAVSMFFASAVDVHAMLSPEASAMRAAAPSQPVQLPEEWIWRGRKPIDLEYMYGNHEPPRPDYIVMHRTD
jgi:hypothetical protein